MSYPFISENICRTIRNEIYSSFESHKDLSMELLDALSAEMHVNSAVELSLSHHLTRQYSSISQLVSQMLTEEALSSSLEKISGLIFNHINSQNQESKKVKFFILDETGIFKPDANSMENRSYVHGASKTNHSIGVGHSYSYLVGDDNTLGQWVVPIDLRIVNSNQSAIKLGFEQFKSQLPKEVSEDTYVLTADSKYSSKESVANIYGLGDSALLLTRLNSKRTLYFPYTGEQNKRGAKKKYGEEFKLHDKETWIEPHEVVEFDMKSARGKLYIVKLKRWNGLIAKGSNGLTMHDKPFDIVKAEVFDSNGKPVNYKNMWLMIAGGRKDLIEIKEIFLRYSKRFKIEHFFRFCKQHLLLGKYQTPDTETQNKWCTFSSLAYLNLLCLSGMIDNEILHPWRKSPVVPKGLSSPYSVKRMASKIIDQIGTPASPCNYKSHGKGRELGTVLPKRGKKPVIVNSKRKKTRSDKKGKLSDCKKIVFASDLDAIDKLKLSKEQIELLKKVA